ncbi:dihydrodipicolinate synthase family protein [Mesorhizobium sp. ASY16-5R]|uniref:dihydrodipicolinate synthase family protein n=1 Tax=Mesorhizobium sp. ASY16-5R TaxID=3445772 RepID=UPI003FA18011
MLDKSAISDLSRSVISVPPLARDLNLVFDAKQNRRVVDHLRAGGVTVLLYGGNANFYNMGLYEYALILDQLKDIAGSDMTCIPSAGPEYGRLRDQVDILKARGFSTVMVLPPSAMHSAEGSKRAVRDFAERLGVPVVLYLKPTDYLSPADTAELVNEGIISWIKYAIVRRDPLDDPYLRELVDKVDRRLIVSGMGELPALVHMRDFGLSAFTSGSVCVAPALSTAMLQAGRDQRWADAEALREKFIPLEDLRNSRGPAPVLHEALTLAGIADCGPALPLMSNYADKDGKVEAAARQLLVLNGKAGQLAASGKA